MNLPKYLLYAGAFLIVLSIFLDMLMQSRKSLITERLISKGLPTPANADVYTLQGILDKA